jgi:hypothetical protein
VIADALNVSFSPLSTRGPHDHFRNVLVQGKVLTNLVKQDDQVADRLVRQRREQKVSGSSMARGLFSNFENNEFITTIVRAQSYFYNFRIFEMF